MLVYEDNFGFLNISEPEERAFFDFVRRQSVLIACERCERPVRLIPPKALCASCVSALEYGAPASMKEYGSQETLLDSARPPRRSLYSRVRQLCAWRGYRQNERIAAQGSSSQRPQIIASDPDLAAITKDVEALNDA